MVKILCLRPYLKYYRKKCVYNDHFIYIQQLTTFQSNLLVIMSNAMNLSPKAD